MSRHTAFTFALLVAAIPVILWAPSASAKVPAIGVGDKVVTHNACQVKQGRQTVATVPRGTELVATHLQGDWVGVRVGSGDDRVPGWIHNRHLHSARLPGSGDYPLDMRLDWKPGETHTFGLDMNIEVYAGGQRMTTRAQMEIDVRVLQGDSGNGSNNGGPADPQSDTTFGLGQLMDLELIHRDMTISMKQGSREFRAVFSEESVQAYLNDRPVPSYQLSKIRADSKPVLDLLRSRVRVKMTEYGKIVKVTGLEDLDPKTQKEVARGFLQAVTLPDKPMTLGEKFTVTKKLEEFCPAEAGPVQSLAGKTLDVVFTLNDVKRRDDGTAVATLTAPIKVNLEDVPIAEMNTNGSVSFDLTTTIVYDVDRGAIEKQTVTGSGNMSVPGQGSASISLDCVFAEKK